MNEILIGLLALSILAGTTQAQESRPAMAAALAPTEVSVRTLAKGLTFQATFKEKISSRRDKIGETVTGVIVADVNDATGALIFPAKSVASIVIKDIRGADQDHPEGTLVLVVRSVNVGSMTFRINTMPATVDTTLSSWAGAPQKMERSQPSTATGIVGRAPKASMSGANLLITPGTAVTFELAEAVTVTS